MTSPRLGAAQVLLRIERGGTTLSAEIERTRHQYDDRRDRGLLLELCSGTLRWRNELDALIRVAARRDLDAIDPPVRAVLRLGAYQLRHLDRVPDHAVVDESVETIKAVGLDRAAGFVNGVLRTLARSPDGHALPARPGPTGSRAEQLAYLTTTLSHPEWLASRWLDRYGFEATEKWCAFNNRSPVLTARLRPGADVADELAALAEAGVVASRADYVTDAVRLPAGSLGRLPEAARSRLRIQDEGSQLVALGVGARAGERILDVCAAPGGKTVLVADQLGPSGFLVAGDRRLRRLGLLRSTLETAGLDLPILALDSRHSLPFGPIFDRVLLDAPCTGLGTLSRDPDLKWSRKENDLADYARAQQAMLAAAAGVVKPGGRLIYATCSSEPEENEQVVSGFLATHPQFQPTAVELPPGVQHRRQLLDDQGRLVTTPPDHGLDAFFSAALACRQRA